MRRVRARGLQDCWIGGIVFKGRTWADLGGRRSEGGEQGPEMGSKWVRFAPSGGWKGAEDVVTVWVPQMVIWVRLEKQT